MFITAFFFIKTQTWKLIVQVQGNGEINYEASFHIVCYHTMALEKKMKKHIGWLQMWKEIDYMLGWEVVLTLLVTE